MGKTLDEKVREYVCKVHADAATYAGVSGNVATAGGLGGTRQGAAYAAISDATMGMIDAYRDSIISGTGMYAISGNELGGVTISSPGNDAWRIHESPDAIRAAATEAEHKRILAVLETCRPTDQPYTRRDWAIEEKGKRDLFAKIMKALGEPVKEGE